MLEKGSLQELNPKTAAELREKTALLRELWPFTWENGMLTVTAELGVNDLYFIEIEA